MSIQYQGTEVVPLGTRPLRNQIARDPRSWRLRFRSEAGLLGGGRHLRSWLWRVERLMNGVADQKPGRRTVSVLEILGWYCKYCRSPGAAVGTARRSDVSITLFAYDVALKFRSELAEDSTRSRPVGPPCRHSESSWPNQAQQASVLARRNTGSYRPTHRPKEPRLRGEGVN